MDPSLYKAAIDGRIEPFQNHPNPLDQLLTPNHNTILHVHLSIRSANTKADFLNKILDLFPTLLLQRNKEGEIPLHMAAKHGRYEAVKILVNRAKALDDDDTDLESGLTAVKKMLRATTEPEKETALHKAARTNHLNELRLLAKEDPEFAYSANSYGETPLYIAACKGYSLLVAEILDSCRLVDYGGPRGRSVLHAAVIENDERMVNKLLEKEKNLIKQTDDNKWSPLHYAAYCGFYDMARLLLTSDASLAHLGDNDKNRTALHVSAMRGNINLMQLFEEFCPDCHEQVDNQGWNALHYVVASKDVDAFGECVKSEWLRGLINNKDNDGNTPLHLFAASHGYLPSFMWEGNFKSEVNIHVFNNKNLTIGDLLSGKFPKEQEEISKSLEDSGSEPTTEFDIQLRGRKRQDEEMRKFVDLRVNTATQIHLLAATVIATVAFAAAFTIPGGYKSEDPNKGTPILIKNAAFIIFIISDTIALVLSTFAVFVHFRMALLDPEDWRKIKHRFYMATTSIIFAMQSMLIAFAAGTYAVLNTSLGLAIAICFIASLVYIEVADVILPEWMTGESKKGSTEEHLRSRPYILMISNFLAGRGMAVHMVAGNPTKQQGCNRERAS